MRPSQPGPSVPSPSRRSLLTAIPTLAVYFALQRQFVSGLTLGSNKG
ncbi:hypothetical protein ABZV96_07780 [Streptomyces misionensis]